MFGPLDIGEFFQIGPDALEAPGLVEGDADMVLGEDAQLVARDTRGAHRGLDPLEEVGPDALAPAVRRDVEPVERPAVLLRVRARVGEPSDGLGVTGPQEDVVRVRDTSRSPGRSYQSSTIVSTAPAPRMSS